jgi:hypothetical protein
MIVLVPIDNRPITYAFPQLIARIAGVDAIVPPASMIGSSKAPTNIEALSNWLDNTIKETQPSCLAVCLDSLIYGGLVASRKSNESLEVLLKRCKSIPRWKQLTGNALQVLAQSSIMRISDNYGGEERSYWSQCGREIFKWSALLHKQRRAVLTVQEKMQLKEVENKISPEVRQDYLAARERNFKVNLQLIEYATMHDIDFLVFGQDDTGKYGLNAWEREELLSEYSRRKLSNVAAYRGADEVLMALLFRCLVSNGSVKPRCSVHFNLEQCKSTISNFEGQSIEESLKAQLNATALEVVPETNADFAVVVHAAKDFQGDHVWLEGHPDHRTLNTTEEVEATMRCLEKIAIPCVLCDVAYANGSDPLLVEQLLSRKDLLNKLWGYAGWNTTGNTIGSALAMGAARWYASEQLQPPVQTRPTNPDTAFKQAMFTRFADEWAYQSQVRPKLSEASDERLNQLMMPYLERLAAVLDFQPKNLQIRFPWKRTFEVEISMDA